MDIYRDPTPQDIQSALCDFLALRGNIDLPHEPHPYATRWALTRAGEQSLPELAAIYLKIRDRDPQTLARAVTSSDFAPALAGAATQLAGITWENAAAELMQYVREIRIRGVRPTALPELDLGEITEQPDAGSSETPLITIDADQSIAAPALYSAKFNLSRAALTDLGDELLARAVSQLTHQTARILARLAAVQLDGATLTEATGTTVGTATLGDALSRLRTAALPGGGYANLPGDVLLVPPGQIGAAHVTRAAMEVPIDIVPLPWLTHSYLLPSPEVLPTITRPIPISGEPRIAAVSPWTNIDGQQTVFDGIMLRYQAYLGIGLVSTYGLIRIRTS